MTIASLCYWTTMGAQAGNTSAKRRSWLTGRHPRIVHSVLLILTLTTSVGFFGCGSSVVHASPALQPPPDTSTRSFTHDMGSSPVPCGPETFAVGISDPQAGTNSLVYETADALEFSGVVCPLVRISNSSYTTKFKHDVQEIQFELGSNTDSIQEYAAWAFFQWDDSVGHHEWTISQQRDQHIDDHNFHTQRNLVKSFPAGTVITIIRPAMNPTFCTNRATLLAVGNDCQTGQQITLIGQ
jgi:hypothetical protein